MLVMIPSWIKRAWGHLFFYGGIFHLVRLINNIAGKRLTIVTYHRIADRKIDDIDASLPYLFTTVDSFREHLKFYRTWYRVISFDELRNNGSGRRLPWNALIITFDDGYEDNYRRAHPLLQEMNLSATVFVAVDKIGREDAASFWWDRLYCYFRELNDREDLQRVLREELPDVIPLYEQFRKDPSTFFSRMNDWDTARIHYMLDQLRARFEDRHAKRDRDNSLMTWKHVHAMADNSIRFGSHTCSHGNLLHMGQEQQRFELCESKKRIEEQTKRRVQAFSYPCGKYDDDVKKAVCDAGYDFAVTTESGVNDLRDRYALKRINVWEGTGSISRGEYSKGYFAFKIAGF
jgi:peptidoglycan/xylan/chitin deacetylase (PgdA/CDA1 family)